MANITNKTHWRLSIFVHKSSDTIIFEGWKIIRIDSTVIQGLIEESNTARVARRLLSWYAFVFTDLSHTSILYY
jgi:hypothetical protein